MIFHKIISYLFFFSLQIERIKKLYDLATKTLEMSQSKKLLAIYEEIVSRLSAAADVEVAFIESQVSTRS